MLESRSLMIGAIAGFTAALLGVGFVGCQKKDEGKAAPAATGTVTATGLPAQSDEELSTPLATVDDVTITVRELQDRINSQSPYVRARYTSLEQKKKLLEDLVRFEVLAKEGLRRGYDKDPDVVRTMKQVMIQKLVKEQFENAVKPEDVTEEEMRAFFEEHKDAYNRDEEVRASAIILKDKAKAEKVAVEAKGEAGKSNSSFRQLVTAHSSDETTKLRGGDLRYFDRNNEDVPKPVIEAAFALGRTGEVAGPIDAGDGRFYIVKLTGRKKPLQKSFEDVKRQIQNRVYRDKRADTQKQFIEELKKKSQITVHEDNLDKVRVDTSASGLSGAPGHGGIPAIDNIPAAQPGDN